MNIEATVIRINDEVQVTDTFKKRTVHVNYAENPVYPQALELEFTQDRCDKCNDLCEGEEYEFSINLRGREWTSPEDVVKVFNTLECWKVSPV